MRFLWHVRAKVTYFLARRLFHWYWFVQQPKGWQWLEGQYSRMANLGDVGAQSFYGHILLFRGQGLAARNEGLRLLRLAAHGGDSKAAYQLGVVSLEGDTDNPPDAAQTARWWEMAVEAGHPLAPIKLSQLYKKGGPGLYADPERAKQFEGMGKPHGF
ncbi:sel1 repeat family protein [Pseudomonas sp. CCI3.2]|uniref:tetratricopeptide repeat protein n=1 Tax=unclassified Pseudomonas TaxID=196821 RepID=UPI002AC9499A|nr:MULTISPECIES: sel1 repeat family protein [unclassified Pseudomonas]MEB0078144.1 sel1 repeat family protein [Pseudomonas sp. MH10out]MEB0093422.1 sel1 repeat family protein [Pseudomonas sp. CCI4.2]MEB0102198.1 sel1 repeat family protein [Pseudomonas sp. CCI3.2]MEB0132319.1 sel1 repeat family protein [Pseudomonas sp. CCI2.4]MEB0158963.1 sel1 repeat family protein [Pseudomonas sp. AH2 (2023)]